MGGGWSLVGSGGGGGPDPKKKKFQQINIHISNVDG